MPAFRFLLLAGLTAAAGLAPVVLFRRTIAFILREITPGTRTSPVNAADNVMSQLMTSTVTSALCFALATIMVLVMIRLARRSSTPALSSLITAVALVLSLGVSAWLVTILKASSVQARDVALHGRTQPATGYFAIR